MISTACMLSLSTLAITYLSWLPVWSTAGWGMLAATIVALWLVLRVGWGRPLPGPLWGLSVIRLLVVTALLLILLGPTTVYESPTSMQRATLTYLFDGSSSMLLGGDVTRWEESLAFVDSAQRSVGQIESSDSQAFRFGHRLTPLVKAESHKDPEHDEALGEAETGPVPRELHGIALDHIAEANATDSRLADAMRQLLPLLDPNNSAGVVLLSDGRVRATESVESLAGYYGKLKIPIHVVPVGHAQGVGDIAIVSLMAASETRKFTETEVQVFFRSFGYTGQRTTVRLVKAGGNVDAVEKTVASIPVTLTGGAQSVALPFRVEAESVDLVAVIDPLPSELTDRNNRITTRMEIDRTKVRVLYIEGNDAQQSLLARLTQILTLPNTQLAATDTLRQALEEDEDIECVVLVSAAGRSRPVPLSTTSSTSTARFPLTRSELFAYDCIVLSNVSPSSLEPEEHEMLAQWVERRGGGFIVCGSESLHPEDWTDSPLAPALPVHLSATKFSAPQQVPVTVAQNRHPIWRLQLEEQASAALLADMPDWSTGVSEAEAKPNTLVLATSETSGGLPLLVAQHYGRGRVLVSTADLAGQAIVTMGQTWGAEASKTVGKFWRNMVYWVTEGAAVGRRRLAAETDKRFYRPGEKLQISLIAYDESAHRTQDYRVYGMLEPSSLDDMSLYSPVLWPENTVRDSGEVGPRIAWGEELRIPAQTLGDGFRIELQLSDSSTEGDGEMRIELTAYEGDESGASFGHGTQVDSTSLRLQVLSDPFEQQNPLPNHEFLARIAALSGGKVLDNPRELANLLSSRVEQHSDPKQELSPAWSQWWVWCLLVGLLTGEWVWRRLVGMA